MKQGGVSTPLTTQASGLRAGLRAGLHVGFERQAAQTPHATALRGLTWSCTYRELDQRANRLAAHLSPLGVGPETRVGLLVPRSLDAVTTILAVLKCGGVYVPLDPAHPTDRLAYMVRDAGVQLLVTRSALHDRASTAGGQAGVQAGVQCVLLDELDLTQDSPADLNVDSLPQAQPGSLAYVMYTSGSTGQPKGVPITHEGVWNLVEDQGYCTFGPSRVHLLLSNLSFDFSTLELWGALLHGACLAVYEDTFVSLSELGRVIQTLRVTTLMITPSLFNLLVGERLVNLGGLEQVLLGGDVPPIRMVRDFLSAVPGCALTNVYGPTENAVFTTCFTQRGPDFDYAVMPIGRSIAGTELHLMDEHGQPVAPGEEGEIWLGGRGLTPGYLGRSDLNARAFVQSPHATTQGGRLYRTGDLARTLPDGNLLFLGRRDLQIKLRGHRVELGEIEAVLREHAAVREAAVVVHPGATEGADKRLLAYVDTFADAFTETQDDSDWVAILQGHLSARLPSYMRPAALVRLAHLPINPTGKLDRRALAALPWPEQSGSDQRAAPARHLSSGPHLATSLVSPILANTGPANPVAADGNDSALEAMTALWQEVLGTKVGPDDDFFALGGTSLLAALLLTRMADRFGHEVHPGVFFNHPTVRTLCASVALMRNKQGSDTWPASIVNLRTGTPELTPLFILGDPFMYRLLVPQIKLDCPVWALHTELGAVEAMATRAITDLRRVQPVGPYRLTGFSFDGLVAYEVACQLAAQGEHTEFLGLIDTATPELEHKLAEATPGLWQRIRLQLRYSRHFSPAKRLRYLLERVKGSLMVRTRMQATDAHYERLVQLARPYRPPPYSGVITVFRATGEVSALMDPLLGWSAFGSQDITVHDLSGLHLDLVRAPVVARQLGQLMGDTLRPHLSSLASSAG